MTSKEEVREFWNDAACGEKLLLATFDIAGFRHQAAERYRLEPYIVSFAGFEATRGRKVLEIGLGLGADHERFAMAGADLRGVDLSPRAVDITRQRLTMQALESDLRRRRCGSVAVWRQHIRSRVFLGRDPPEPRYASSHARDSAC